MEVYMSLEIISNDMFREYPEVVTIEDVMEMLGIGRTLAYDIIRNGRLKTVKIGKRYIIPKQSVINFLATAN